MQILFKPWIGSFFTKNYRDVRSPLFLGESHYKADLPEDEFTIRCINKYALSDRPLRYFTKMVRAFYERDVDRKEAWQHVAFSNLIQESLPDSRIPPTEGQWERGCKAFPLILEYVQPSCLVIYGYRLGERIKTYTENRNEKFLFNLKYKNQNLPVVIVKHPSSNFSYKEAEEKIGFLKDRLKRTS
jgi:hypothetical protein